MSLADQRVETTHQWKLEQGFWSQWHTQRWRDPDQKADDTQRWRHPDQKVEMSKLRFLKSLSLADQKVETTPPPESWNLGFWSQCHLLIKQCRTPWSKSCRHPKVETHLIKRCRHPNLGFSCQCVTCWSKGGDNLCQWKFELRFLKSVSLADQKGSDTLINMWRLPKAETPWSKERQPNLGFWNKCHLLIKRLRHPNLGF